jgi:hypothetical protein
MPVAKFNEKSRYIASSRDRLRALTHVFQVDIQRQLFSSALK